VVPPDSTVVDWVPFDAGMAAAEGERDAACLALIDKWRDTTSLRAVRTTDLPLSAPPRVELLAVRDGVAVRVTVQGGPQAMNYRWHSHGAIEGDGRQVRWTPDGADDHIRVAVRSKGGVAVVSVRGRSVRDAEPPDEAPA
jgi:hypothetical protein